MYNGNFKVIKTQIVFLVLENIITNFLAIVNKNFLIFSKKYDILININKYICNCKNLY
jgi:hypothetical protein